MQETRHLRSMVARYSFIFAAAAELISMIFTKGFNAGFAYGLLLGTAIGVVNFNLLSFTVDKAFSKSATKLGALSMLGFMIRMAMIGGAFLMAYKLGTPAAIACIIGFVMTRISIYYIHFIKKSIFRRE